MTDPSNTSRGWIGGYQGQWLRGDLIAGATTAAVIIPQALGYATIAGLPVEIGLYTCIFPMLVYAFVGTSRRLSFSTTSTIVAVTGVALAGLGLAETEDMISATATLTMLVGLLLLGFRLLQLGWVVEAISEATVTGLKFGVGATVIVDQLLRIVGIEGPAGRFLGSVGDFVAGLGDLDGPTTILAASTLVGLFVLKRIGPRVPGALLAIAAGIVLVAWFGLADAGVALIDEVPLGLPTPAMPSLDLVGLLLPAALAISVMAYMETMTAARIARTIDDPSLDNNREFVANGLAAVVGSVFQSLPPAGGFSQTQVNTQSGARTQLSGVVTALLALAVALFFAPVLSDLPQATLAAVVIVSVSGLLDIAAFRHLWQIDRAELTLAVLTALAALAFDLIVGVAVGVVLTFYLVLRSLNHPVVIELRRDPESGDFLPAREGDPVVPGLLVLRVEGGIYTLNVRRVQDEVIGAVADCEQDLKVLVLDTSGTSDTSVTVLDVLLETDQRLANRGIDLWVAALPQKTMEKATRTMAYDDWVARGRIHPSVASAARSYEELGLGDESRC